MITYFALLNSLGATFIKANPGKILKKVVNEIANEYNYLAFK
jgi:hypothetical protein